MSRGIKLKSIKLNIKTIDTEIKSTISRKKIINLKIKIKI